MRWGKAGWEVPIRGAAGGQGSQSEYGMQGADLSSAMNRIFDLPASLSSILHDNINIRRLSSESPLGMASRVEQVGLKVLAGRDGRCWRWRQDSIYAPFLGFLAKMELKSHTQCCHWIAGSICKDCSVIGSPAGVGADLSVEAAGCAQAARHRLHRGHRGYQRCYSQPGAEISREVFACLFTNWLKEEGEKQKKDAAHPKKKNTNMGYHKARG